MHSALTSKKATREERSSTFNLRRWLGGSIAPYIFIAPFFVLFAIFGLYPLLFALHTSFTYWHGGDEWRYVGLSNYLFLLGDTMFWESLLNSLYLWLFIVPVQTLGAIFIAALLVNPILRLRWLFRTIFLTPYVVPLIAIAQVWLVLFDKDFGAVNAVLNLLHLPDVGWLTTSEWAKPTIGLLVLWKSSGFAVLVMMAAIQSIPLEYYEAASLDGAGSLARFWYVTLPLLKRAIIFFVVISTMGVIQLFAEPMVMTSGGPYNSTTTAGFRLWGFINNSDLGTGAANSFLLMVLMVGLALLMMRFMRNEEA